MSKTIWKLRPHDYWRIGEHESWFADLAAEGLHIKKMGPYFARFEKGASQQMKYRIEVSGKKGISDEQIDVYEEAGWQYITSFQHFHVFASPVEWEATELHTDPAEQAFTLSALTKQLKFHACLTILAALLSAGMIWSIWFLDGTPLLQLVKGGNLIQIGLVLFMALIASTSLRAALSISQLRNSLLDGKLINHKAPWKKGKYITSLFFLSFAVIYFIFTLFNLLQLVNQESETLPTGEVDYPFVRLAEMESSATMVRDEYWYDDVDMANSYEKKWSLLAPVQYEMIESGVVADKMWQDGSGVYTPSLEMEVFQVRWPWISEPLADDLVKWYSDEDQYIFTEIEHPYFEKLVVQKDESSVQFVAKKDDVVMHVRYYGYSNPAQLIEQVAQKWAAYY